MPWHYMQLKNLFSILPAVAGMVLMVLKIVQRD
jgi:hypothetical protein